MEQPIPDRAARRREATMEKARLAGERRRRLSEEKASSRHGGPANPNANGGAPPPPRPADAHELPRLPQRRPIVRRRRQPSEAAAVAADGGSEALEEAMLLAAIEVSLGGEPPAHLPNLDDAFEGRRRRRRQPQPEVVHGIPMTYEALSQLEDVKVGLSADLMCFIRCDAAGAAACGERCPVCITDVQMEEQIMTLPCRHVYHEECLRPWLAENKRCPTCKVELTEEFLLSQFE